jgi:DNA polymerase I
MPNKSATAPAQPTGKLILIDGHSLAYRAFFAMMNTPLSVRHDDGTDEMTGAVFAFTNMLLKVWASEKPDYIAVAFDVGRTFRDDIYPEYKGTREKMPDDLSKQIKRIQQMVQAFDIPIFTADGFEADDVLGTLSHRASGEGLNVVIVTGDRDSLQLVNPRVKVLTSKQRFDDILVYDEALVLENYGVRVDQFIDYKALLGDTSDNVPGVKGIGEKTAVALLNTYDNLDAIYAKLDEVKPARAKTALEAGKDSAYLSKTLVTIKTDVPLDVDWEACKAEADYNRVLSLLRELRFESLIKRIPQAAGAEGDKGKGGKGDGGQLGLFAADEASIQSPISNLQSPAPNPSVPTQVRLVDSDDAYKELLKALNGASLIAFDTETTGTDPMRDEMVGMSFSVKAGEGWYLPTEKTEVRSQKSEVEWSLDPTSPKFEPIAKALQNKKSQLVCHNAKFDLGVLKNLGVEIHKPVLDTMLAQFLIDPGGQSLGLKNLAFTLLGWQMTEISELIGKGKKQITMREVPVASVAPYAAADADATIHLWELLQPQLIAKKQDALFYDVETPLIPVLLDMEFSGVALDMAYLGELSVQITERLRELEKTIYNEAGTVFNINSPKQLSELLFGKLQLPAEASWKTQSGGLSTNIEVLENLKDKHAVIPPIIEHRELSKLKGTYVDALPQLINPNTGRVHTDFNQAGAVTGRMSSSNPNLQNIPIKSEMGRRVRKAFIARKGNRLISADYSQVELRILAHMADDEFMRSAFERGEDIHATTAAAIYDTPLQDVNAMQRSNAKRINFGIAYGMGPFALAQNTGMSMDEARAFINKYFERFPKVKAWLDNTKLIAAEQGFVETVLGRRRYFPELRAGSGAAEMMKRRAEREAINHPVQGSAADIMKIAMIRIHAALREGGYAAKMTLQVHDELVFDCPTSELEAVSKLVKHEMEGAYSMSVPLRADVVSGKNWDDSA